MGKGGWGLRAAATTLLSFRDAKLRIDKLLSVSGGKASEVLGWNSIPVGITCWQSAGKEPALLRPRKKFAVLHSTGQRWLAMQTAPALKFLES